MPIRSPTTTTPVAMPTRAASDVPPGPVNAATASTSANPARTARSAEVLVGARIAEIGEHAVAHELGDKPLEARDHPGAGVLIGADHIAHVLGVEPLRKRRGPDEVAEQHGQLPALGPPGRGWRRGGGAVAGFVPIHPQGCHGVEQLPAMPDDGHAKVRQVVRRQRRQDFSVDLVVAECSLVAIEPEVPEPTPNVHTSSPMITVTLTEGMIPAQPCFVTGEGGHRTDKLLFSLTYRRGGAT